jgi:gamma-glutamyl-gamma-aminobutyrate hydrolase PuuD
VKKVLIVNGSREYRELFESLGFGITADVETADLVCFTGGADVTPSYYGDTKHVLTYNDEQRDAHEAYVFSLAKSHKKPMVGICRGAQFLNVMSGGRMFQHVTKHTGSHSITDLQTGETVYVSSTHHQMMKIAPEALLVASSSLHGEREWYDGQVFKRDVSEQDNEVAYYEKTKCLCFQPHPEFRSADYEGMRLYFASLLKRFFSL